MGGAASMTGVTSNDGVERYFCHQCHRFFARSHGGGDIQCPHCDSMFVEEVSSAGRGGPADIFSSRGGQMLTSDQSRRIMNATALLRLLEVQLREELEFLSRAAPPPNRKKQMTNIMKFKCRTINLNMDQLCSQPSCPICTIDFAVEGEATRLPCSHLFHNACVMPWLDMKQNCPICRTEISPDVLELQEYEKYSVKELIEQLSVMEVEVTDVETKTSGDLAFILHKHLKKLEKDEQDREASDEAERMTYEQQRRANVERFNEGPNTRFGPGNLLLMDANHSMQGGISSSQSMGRILSFPEFYHQRRLQQRLEEERSTDRINVRSNAEEEMRMQPTRPRVHTNSTDSDDEPSPYHVRIRPNITRSFPFSSRAEPVSHPRVHLLTMESDADELEREIMLPNLLRLTNTIDIDNDDSDTSERLRDMDRIERDMENRRRVELENAEREDLADLNEWEASQGLPLTTSFRTPPTAERAMLGYAQSFISRVADTAVSSRVSSLMTTDSPIQRRSRTIFDDDFDSIPESPRTNTRRLIESVASEDD